MLSYDELENISRLKRINLINAEKDYLQDMMLFSLYSNIGKELVFKGGTCLYKIYKLNRFSEDLDFTLTKKVDIEKIADKIISDLGLLNIKVRLKEIKEYKNEINLGFLINGPLYKGSKETQCFIPFNISQRERVLLEVKRESIIPLYKEIPNFEIFVMNEKEILAEKIRAIFTREKPRDVYDLWFLITRLKVEFDLELASNKLAFYNLKFDYSGFRKRVKRLGSLWDSDLRNLVIGELEDFKNVKKDILDKIREG